jgi:uncharacterized protein (TIGR01777 family)
MRVLVSGSTGLIGSELVRQLKERGDEVIALTRHRDEPGVYWDLNKFHANPDDFERFDAIVHLAGTSIGERRLTERRQRLVWDSRVITTEFLIQNLEKAKIKPKTLVVASAVGFYGDRGEEELTEASEKGDGFFAALCEVWEKEAREAEKFGVRVANLRSGVVIDANGGSLSKQLTMFRLNIGGRLGNGRQWMSWISLPDEVRAIMHVLDTPSLSGPVNLTSPEPVMNGAYTAALALALNRLAVIPTPAPLLKLVLGEIMANELLLTSQKVHPKKLQDSGFVFEFPFLLDALNNTLHPPEPDEDEPADPETDTTKPNEEA